jgi:hypothetical protein
MRLLKRYASIYGLFIFGEAMMLVCFLWVTVQFSYRLRSYCLAATASGE